MIIDAAGILMRFLKGRSAFSRIARALLVIGLVFIFVKCGKEKAIQPVQAPYHPSDYRSSKSSNFHGSQSNYHNDKCLSCHPVSGTADDGTTCIACHTSSEVRNCRTCHADLISADSVHPHLAAGLECNSCHAGYSLADSSIGSATHLNGGRDLTLDSLGTCKPCHGTGADTARVYWNRGTGVWKNSPGFCESCHDGSSVINGRRAPNVMQFFAVSGHGHKGPYPENQHKKDGPGYSCLVCHDPALPGHLDNIKGDKLLRINNDTSGLCLDCHRVGQRGKGVLGDSAVSKAGRHSFRVTGNYSSVSQYNYECDVCHDPHGKSNMTMIKDSVDGGLGSGFVPVPFKDSAQFDLTETAFDGICDACHAPGLGPHNLTGKGANHNQGMACWQCHSHQISFDTLPSVIVSMAMTPRTAAMNIGGTIKFTAEGTNNYSKTIDLSRRATWTSSNTGIIMATDSGMVIARTNGQAVVTARYGAFVDSIRITVSTKLEMAGLISITIAPSSPTVVSNSTLQLTASGLFPGNTTLTVTDSLLWASSNASIASVAGKGLIRGESAGTAMIMASYGSVIKIVAFKVNP